MAFDIRELRGMYSNMSIQSFARIFEKYRHSPELLKMLDRVERRALLDKAEEQRLLERLEKRLSASVLHSQLNIVVPADVDHEHAQAILMYGFLMPGQRTIFVGSNLIPEKHVRHNVQTKLGFRFSDKKFKAALRYLRNEGIFNHKASQEGGGYRLSLKTAWDDAAVKSHGQQILRVALNFVRKKEY